MFLMDSVSAVSATQVILALGTLVNIPTTVIAFLNVNVDPVDILLWRSHRLQHLLASTSKISRSQATRIKLPAVLLGHVAWY